MGQIKSTNCCPKPKPFSHNFKCEHDSGIANILRWCGFIKSWVWFYSSVCFGAKLQSLIGQLFWDFEIIGIVSCEINSRISQSAKPLKLLKIHHFTFTPPSAPPL